MAIVIMVAGAMLGALVEVFRVKHRWVPFGATVAVTLVGLGIMAWRAPSAATLAYFVVPLMMAMIVVGDVLHERALRRSSGAPT